MFKSSRWRSEKNKIKVGFKLQFHATQVPQVVGNALIVSVIPADNGKPTMKLEKATIREGRCYWETPIFKTVKLVQDLKTGKISEKIYHFQVSNGSSKTGILGEVSIDFADYVEAIKPSSVSLPLKNAKSRAVLHISIQRMQENIDHREVDESEVTKLKPEEKSLKANLNNCDINGSIHTNSIEDASCNKATSNNAELNGHHKASSGSDIMSSSDSGSGFDTPRELALKNNDNQEPPSFLPSLNNNSMCQKSTVDPSSVIYEEHQGPQSDSLVGSDHGLSTDDSKNDSQDTLPRERYLQASDIEIEKLKSDLNVLARQAEVSELELQTLRKQIVKESKRRQDLFREVVNLKEERNGLKEECERLKASQKPQDEAKVKNKLQFQGGDPRALVEELRQQLNYEKDLNANLQLQMQKTQESNSELVLAVRNLDEMLEQKNKDVLYLSNKLGTSENLGELQESISKCQTDDDEQKALEELVKEHNDAKEAYLLEQNIMDLCSEIQIYRRDKDELEMQMEQLALDYEILKQEKHGMSYKLEQTQLQEQLKMRYECLGSFAVMNDLEAQIEDLESELKKQSKELSDSLATIDKFETHVKSLEEELEKQVQEFEADLEAVTHAKVEQEQRAIQAEEALRITRLKNANTAERLQVELKRLSVQMASTFDANEKLAMKALTEANELRLQKNHLEGMLQKADEELQSVTEKIKLFEGQVKLKETALETSANSFLAKEKDLQNKVKEVESRLEELNQSSAKLCEYEIHKVAKDTQGITLNDSMPEEVSDTDKNLSTENGVEMSTKKSGDEMSLKEVKASTFDSKYEGNLDETVLGMAFLKQRNLSMECELKEMQERYSEISLKFAEVEGERQQLLMTVRNLKNAKKS